MPLPYVSRASSRKYSPISASWNNTCAFISQRRHYNVLCAATPNPKGTSPIENTATFWYFGVDYVILPSPARVILPPYKNFCSWLGFTQILKTEYCAMYYNAVIWIRIFPLCVTLANKTPMPIKLFFATQLANFASLTGMYHIRFLCSLKTCSSSPLCYNKCVVFAPIYWDSFSNNFLVSY